VSFAAAHADGRPQRALPQKPKLESLNLGKNMSIESENFDIPLARDAGRWRCVPPFRVVYLYQAIEGSKEQ
jgi:hypothetical protein